MRPALRIAPHGLRVSSGWRVMFLAWASFLTLAGAQVGEGQQAAAPIVIPEFHTKGERFEGIARRIEELSRLHDPKRTGVRIELRKADPNAEFAATRTQTLEFLFFDTPVSELVPIVCHAAQLEFRSHGNTYVVSDGTAPIFDDPRSRSFAVKSEFFEHLAKANEGKTDHDAIAGFVRSRCLVPPTGTRFERTGPGTRLRVTSSDAGLAECGRFLRELDYLDCRLGVRINVRALWIGDRGFVPRTRLAMDAMDAGRQEMLREALADPERGRVLGEVELVGALGGELRGTIDGMSRPITLSAVPKSTGAGISPLLSVSLECRESRAGGEGVSLRQRFVAWSGDFLLTQLPSPRGEAGAAGRSPSCLAIGVDLVEEDTGHVRGPPVSWSVPEPARRDPPAFESVILPRVEFDETPLAECFRSIVRDARRHSGDTPLPPLGFIGPHLRGEPDARPRTTLRIPDSVCLGDALHYAAHGALHYAAHGAGFRCQVTEQVAVLTRKGMRVGPLATGYFPAEAQRLPQIPPDCREFFERFAVRFPRGAGVYWDQRSSRIIARTTLPELRKIRMLLQEPVTWPEQVLVQAVLADVHDPGLLASSQAGGIWHWRLRAALLFGARSSAVDILHHGEVITQSGVTASYRVPSGEGVRAPVGLEATPVVGKDGYTMHLNVHWRDPEREFRSTLSISDGDVIVLRQDRGRRADGRRKPETQRILAFSATELGRHGAVFQPRDVAPPPGPSGTEDEPAPDPPGARRPGAVEGVTDLEALCDRTVLDRFAVDGLPLTEAVDAVEERLKRLVPDVETPVLVRSFLPIGGAAVEEGEDGLGFGADFEGTAERPEPPPAPPPPRHQQPVSLGLRQVSLGDVIRCLCLQTDLRWRFERSYVVVGGRRCDGETRFYPVSLGVAAFLDGLRERFPSPPERPPAGPQAGDNDDDDDDDWRSSQSWLHVFREAFGLLRHDGGAAARHARTEMLEMHGEPEDLRLLEGLLSCVSPDPAQAQVWVEIVRAGTRDEGSVGHVERGCACEAVGEFGERMSVSQRVEVAGGAGDEWLSVALTPAILRWPDVMRCRVACTVRGGSPDSPAVAETRGTLLLPVGRTTTVSLPVAERGRDGASPPATSLRLHGRLITPAGLDYRPPRPDRVPPSEAARVLRMRRRLASLRLQGLEFVEPTLPEVADGLRAALQKLDPDGPGGNIVLAANPHRSDAPDPETPSRVEGTLSLDGLTALQALSRMRQAFRTPVCILGTAVVIGRDRPGQEFTVVGVSPGTLLGQPMPTSAEERADMHRDIEKLLRDNGVLFLKGDHAFALCARPSVLAIGRPGFVGQVEEVLERLRPVYTQIVVSARLVNGNGDFLATYPITTVPSTSGTCIVHGDTPSRLDVTPRWGPERERLTLSLAWQSLAGSDDAVQEALNLEPGEEASVPLGAGAGRRLLVAARVSRLDPETE